MLQRPQEMEIQCLSAVCVVVCVWVCVRERVCMRMNVWELRQFPFQMSSYLRAGEQRQSQRPLFHRCSFGKRREGGGTSVSIYGSAGIPPRDRAAHLYSPHVRLILQEKLTGWWVRRQRGGGRRVGERKSPPPSCERRWSSSSSPPSYATDFIVTTPFFHFTHTCTWMSTRSYVEMFIHKCCWQGRYSKLKMTGTHLFWQHFLCKDTTYEGVSARTWHQDVWMWICAHRVASLGLSSINFSLINQKRTVAPHFCLLGRLSFILFYPPSLFGDLSQ